MTITTTVKNTGIALSCAASALTIEATETAVRRATGMRWHELAGREGAFGATGVKLAPLSAPVSRHTYVLNTVDLPTIKQFRVPSPPGRCT